MGKVLLFILQSNIEDCERQTFFFFYFTIRFNGKGQNQQFFEQETPKKNENATNFKEKNKNENKLNEDTTEGSTKTKIIGTGLWKGRTPSKGNEDFVLFIANHFIFEIVLFNYLKHRYWNWHHHFTSIRKVRQAMASNPIQQFLPRREIRYHHKRNVSLFELRNDNFPHLLSALNNAPANPFCRVVSESFDGVLAGRTTQRNFWRHSSLLSPIHGRVSGVLMQYTRGDKAEVGGWAPQTTCACRHPLCVESADLLLPSPPLFPLTEGCS